MLKSTGAVLLFLLMAAVASGGSLLDSMLSSELSQQEQGPQPDFGLYGDVPSAPEAKKSLPKAVFLSAVLPGAGQYYVGAKREAKAFLIAETTMWAGYLGLNWFGRRARDDYKLYAISRAGANPETTSEDYYYAMEVYRTNDAYNEEIRREARRMYPNDVEAQEEYVLEHGFWEEDSWSWKDTEAWEDYGRLRTTSRDHFHKASYCIGATVLNRLVSAIFAAKSVKDYNAGLEGGPSQLNLRFEPDLEDTGIRVVLRYTY